MYTPSYTSNIHQYINKSYTSNGVMYTGPVQGGLTPRRPSQPALAGPVPPVRPPLRARAAAARAAPPRAAPARPPLPASAPAQAARWPRAAPAPGPPRRELERVDGAVTLALVEEDLAARLEHDLSARVAEPARDGTR